MVVAVKTNRPKMLNVGRHFDVLHVIGHSPSSSPTSPRSPKTPKSGSPMQGSPTVECHGRDNSHNEGDAKMDSMFATPSVITVESP